MTCAIIDDEPLAAQLLQSYAEKVPFLQLTGVYNSAVQAMRDLRTSPVDLLFLDIQMPELSGLEFATILSPQTMIIFTTAFDRYAVDSYRVNTVDYLLKPIAYEAFLRAATKALDRMKQTERSESQQADRFFYVKSDYKIVRIFYDDILYIEGVKDYVRIVTTDNNIMALMNMKSLEDQLPSPEFLRTHRSYIVHMPKVQAVDRFRLVIGSMHIPISDTYKDIIQKYIENHSM